MEMIRFDNVSFTYPLADHPALSEVGFSVEESEFLVICGKSGCGKTTLLRQMKKNLAPYGDLTGDILYCGEPVETLDDRRSASEIGFVQQNPDNQIVTDKVWHELASGLESLGLESAAIRRRVAEMASYFDIQSWFRKDVSELSGGQKQLLNLASIMVMQPRLLVLDEPTSQLDPIAASEFLQTVRRINRDLGVTVILSEHRLEEAFTMADHVLVMDRGSVLACDAPRSIGAQLARQEHPMFYGLPAVTKIYHTVTTDQPERPERQDELATGSLTGPADGPLTVREGRLWLKEEAAAAELDVRTAEQILHEVREEKTETQPPAPRKADVDFAIRTKELWFRYRKDSPDVLRDLNLQVQRGILYCLLGGNGVGKSTLLKVLQGLLKPRRGSVEIRGAAAMLPQNPQALFSEITVEDDLLEALHYTGKTDEEKADAVESMLKLLQIEHLRAVHPYDLSGGEQQRLALGKVLLLEPEILLLDEPTKGLDPFFKITLAQILKDLTARGITILMVSHDIEFCAEYADRCAMFFDGGIVSEGEAETFFTGNSFYTTTANRIAREFFPGAITWEEVAECIRSMKSIAANAS